MSQSRTPERLRHHYEVEKELAARLRASSRAERPALFKQLYQELFDRVPDHPRLVRRESAEESRHKVDGQLRLLRPFLKAGCTLVEFAPGDCRLAYRAASMTGKVIGVDISDQRGAEDQANAPANFELVVYDGYDLALPSGTADVVFSYQFLEHLHPDDIGPHFELAHRLLKPGGWYVFDTPHRLSGPHDISAVAGSELVCFHFREWTCRDMRRELLARGFRDTRIIRFGRIWGSPVFRFAWESCERLCALLPARLRKKIAGRAFLSVAMAAVR